MLGNTSASLDKHEKDNHMTTAQISHCKKKDEIQASVRILVADGHRLFREGLKKVFESCPDMDVVGQAADGAEVLSLINVLRPDILLLDPSMNKTGGLQILRRVQRMNIRTIILTAEIDQQEAIRALQLGASAVVRKESSLPELLHCIRSVYAGGIINGQRKSSDLAQPWRGARSGITRREMEIIAAVVAGCSNKEIAVRLLISEQTIKHHMSKIFIKTGVSSRLQLALYAGKNILVRDSKFNHVPEQDEPSRLTGTLHSFPVSTMAL
jgi:two-component system nitrate/nitrite response regulator NarL